MKTNYFYILYFTDEWKAGRKWIKILENTTREKREVERTEGKENAPTFLL